jgi:hypothetical protein
MERYQPIPIEQYQYDIEHDDFPPFLLRYGQTIHRSLSSGERYLAQQESICPEETLKNKAERVTNKLPATS